MRSRRKPGPLKRLKSGSMPRMLLFVDTECYTEEYRPGHYRFPLRLGVAILIRLKKDGEIRKRTVHHFTTTDEFMRILSENTYKKTVLYAFAHNWAFDIRVLGLPERFKALGWENGPPIINHRVFLWRVKTDKGTIRFVDTANLGVQSVEQLGADLGYPKLEVDFDTVSDEELRTYCQRDTEIIERFVLAYLDYIREHRLGGFRLTLPSQALAAFRTRFMLEPPIIHIHDRALELERDGYFGGRVECYWIGTPPGEKFYYLDVNSMYPAAMSVRRLPTSLVCYSENIPVRYLGARMANYYVIADVSLKTETPAYPYRWNGKLLFPTGEFRTVLHYPELLRAYQAKDIKAVHRYAAYTYGPILADYVEFFYQQKVKHSLESNKSWRFIDKLFLNSLYGKFGQRMPHRIKLSEDGFPGVWRLVIYAAESRQEYQEICWYGEIWRDWKDGESTYSMPAIAGAVTATARMILWEYILKAGRENVFYVDTDSLIVNQQGYERLLSSISKTDLGKLKLEDVTDQVIIHNCKDYEFGETKKIKGVPKKATLVRDGLWDYLQFQGFTTWLNRGGEGVPTARITRKQRIAYYAKGIVWPDGHVTPQPLGPWAD